MSDPAPLRLLASGRLIDPDELARLYSYPDDDADSRRTWVRANFVSSIDGAATVAGKSAGLSGPGDRALFSLLRSLADVIVVGAGTVRTENYSGARLNITQRQQRQARGQSEVPPLAIVSGSGRLERNLPVFTRTEVSPLVLTSTAAADETAGRLADLAEVIDCSTDNPQRVDGAAVLAALGNRGRRRVLTEGGPTLLGSFIEAGLLDELCLTVAPYLVGGQDGQAPRIAAGPGQARTPMRCVHLLTDDAGYQYARYVRGA